MESIFSKVPPAKPPSIYDKIGAEITHIKKGQTGTAREGSDAGTKTGAWLATIAMGLLIVLFFMDPFLFAMHKSDAIRAYVYLHNYDSASNTDALVATHIFSDDEIAAMNAQHGSFQNYFPSPAAAQQKAAAIVSYVNGLHDLRYGRYEDLDPIGKLRYLLFVRIGLFPPTYWPGLNPSVY